MTTISIVVDTFSLRKDKEEYCWRIVDNDKRSVLAFGATSSIEESFRCGKKRYEELKPIIESNRDLMNAWKDFVF